MHWLRLHCAQHVTCWLGHPMLKSSLLLHFLRSLGTWVKITASLRAKHMPSEGAVVSSIWVSFSRCGPSVSKCWLVLVIWIDRWWELLVRMYKWEGCLHCWLIKLLLEEYLYVPIVNFMFNFVLPCACVCTCWFSLEQCHSHPCNRFQRF